MARHRPRFRRPINPMFLSSEACRAMLSRIGWADRPMGPVWPRIAVARHIPTETLDEPMLEELAGCSYAYSHLLTRPDFTGWRVEYVVRFCVAGLLAGDRDPAPYSPWNCGGGPGSHEGWVLGEMVKHGKLTAAHPALQPVWDIIQGAVEGRESVYRAAIVARLVQYTPDAPSEVLALTPLLPGVGSSYLYHVISHPQATPLFLARAVERCQATGETHMLSRLASDPGVRRAPDVMMALWSWALAKADFWQGWQGMVDIARATPPGALLAERWAELVRWSARGQEAQTRTRADDLAAQFLELGNEQRASLTSDQLAAFCLSPWAAVRQEAILALGRQAAQGDAAA